MSDIHFYHNAEDKLATACRLTAKAFGAGRKVALRVPDPSQARQLDRLLWTFEQISFLPHVQLDSPLAGETPVVIGDPPAGQWPHQDVLINLGQDLPQGVADFQMVVEVVGQGEDDRQPARNRWRHYKSAGHTLTAYGLGAP